MATKRHTSVPAIPTEPWYRGANIPMRLIRRFARQVAERFKPDKIILFGSYAYGTPHEDSDVDILVVMPAHNQIDQSVKISLEIDPPFPLDLIVRTPENMAWRLAQTESFPTEITSKGKVLYEKGHPRVGAKSGSRRARRRPYARGKRAATRPVLFSRAAGRREVLEGASSGTWIAPRPYPGVRGFARRVVTT
jgi:predicted nucleotidyltransferase